MTAPLSCEAARELIFDYVDGQLSERDEIMLLEHINSCDSCATELRDAKKVLELIKSARFDAPSELRRSVMDEISKIPQDSKILTPKKKYFIPWGTIAAACAVVMLTLIGRGGFAPGDGLVEEGTVPGLDINAPESYQIKMIDDMENPDSPAQYSGDFEIKDDSSVIVETTASTILLSPSTPSVKEFVGVDEASDAQLDALASKYKNDVDKYPIVFVNEADFEGLAPDVEPKTYSDDEYTITCYTITENAYVALCGYLELFEKKEIDYRALVPSNAEFAVCEIRLVRTVKK